MEYQYELQTFIDAHYNPAALELAEAPDFVIAGLDEPFSVMLIKLIRAKGRDEKDIYKRANLDRRHFSKIRSNTNYLPSKKTVLAVAVALELTLAETRMLLERAGYALSRGLLSDVIIEYFITKGKYNIFEINECLSKYGQPDIGGAVE